LYVSALAAPDTIDTMPEKTLLAFAEHGQLHGVMPTDGKEAEETLAKITQAGVDIDALAAQLQTEGAASFVKSWNDLLKRIVDKTGQLEDASKGPAAK
jgi:transaldolase